jgi:hypothetical protein
VAILGILGAMAYAVGLAVFWLQFILTFRRTAAERGIIAIAFEKENEWGLGQVIALFSWVPLMIELVLAAVYTFHEKDLPCRCPRCKARWRSVVECWNHEEQEEGANTAPVVVQHAA